MFQTEPYTFRIDSTIAVSVAKRRCGNVLGCRGKATKLAVLARAILTLTAVWRNFRGECASAVDSVWYMGLGVKTI
jgi:hypothetical protein